jgi:hypothetical protein
MSYSLSIPRTLKKDFPSKVVAAVKVAFQHLILEEAAAIKNTIINLLVRFNESEDGPYVSAIVSGHVRTVNDKSGSNFLSISMTSAQKESDN